MVGTPNVDPATVLEIIIPQYGENKAKMDALKKVCDAENKDIKKLMKLCGQSEVSADGWTAKYSVQRRESMDEDILLDIMKSDPVLAFKCEDLGIIKTKEYIDFDALERAIYTGSISPESVIAMDKAKQTKEVEVLKVSKEKSNG